MIGYIVMSIGLVVAMLLLHQLWLAVSIESRDDEWLDALRAVSEELERLRSQVESQED